MGNRELHLNYILDKINKFGIESLTKYDKKYLDAYDKKTGMELKILLSGDGLFKFIYERTEVDGDMVYYHGIMILPDLEFENGKTICGELEGYIMEFKNGQTATIFDKEDIDILDFCCGYEYELDLFIDYIIYTIKDEQL